MTPLEFTVTGVAQPKGSTKAFGFKSFNAEGKEVIRSKTINDNPKGRQWQDQVAIAARVELRRREDRGLTVDAVQLWVRFYLARPKKYTTRAYRNGREVAHVSKPDLDKLVRCVKDALTGVVWRDDSQVVKISAWKDYANVDEPPHAIIRVAPVVVSAPLLADAHAV